MAADFDLTEDDVRWTLEAVHWAMCVWSILIGLYLLLVPERRFGESFLLLTTYDQLRYGLGVVYVLAGVLMAYAIGKRQRRAMSVGTLTAGGATWVLAVFLVFGAFRSATGGFAPLFCLYVGGHMLLQHALLRRG